MSPLMILLSFMLPMLIAAIQTVNGDDLHTLLPSQPGGDVLNVTQCYCQNSTPLTPNGTFGYYYQFDYYNFHLEQPFSLVVNCTSRSPKNSLGKDPAGCMDEISRFKDPACHVYADGNKFCFKFKESVNNPPDHSIPSKSKYCFNKQKRGVPAKASEVRAQDDVNNNCDVHCDELGGLKTVETAQSLIPGIGPVTNSIVSYSDLDDMCDKCA